MSISLNAEPLKPAVAFPYLGRIVAYNNSDWESLYQNLRKARRWWGMVAEVVMNTRAMVRSRGLLYKAVVKTVLIYERYLGGGGGRVKSTR